MPEILLSRRCFRNVVNLPIVAIGGAGKPEHFKEILNISGVAAAAANVLNHFEHSIALIKHAVTVGGTLSGQTIRLQPGLTYADFETDNAGRLERLHHSILTERMMKTIEGSSL